MQLANGRALRLSRTRWLVRLRTVRAVVLVSASIVGRRPTGDGRLDRAEVGGEAVDACGRGGCGGGRRRRSWRGR